MPSPSARRRSGNGGAAGRQDSSRLLGDQLLMSIAVATALATTDGPGADFVLKREHCLQALRGTRGGGKCSQWERLKNPLAGVRVGNKY